ncbi:7-deoxyloganetic acid glucosyl transferase-like [Nicotiana tomentosiformis]|uniref:7-deoxyloganetic acid glucosyl transferase-like n=1 Tax=Nicotiana tomentosiformis TaxID=4098 RepID=UPI00051B38B6|nr:7-deoxyloganetic acid glucosyl transferase-like [Nicotiana tomentosiformis]
MEKTEFPPHVVIFPFPVQGHVNPMLKLAELLCLSGIHVTFINTLSIQNRLSRNTDIQSRFNRFPGFRFETIPDGLSNKVPQTYQETHKVMVIFDSLRSTAKPILKEIILAAGCPSGSSEVTRQGPVTCVIADGILSVALEVAEDVGIPILYFRTASAASFWIYLCLPQLIQNGELPFPGNELDVPIASIKGMESLLRRRDLPSFCRVDSVDVPILQMVLTETQKTLRTKGLILNTFEEVEGPILDQIRNHLPKLYSIGPLHAHLKNKIASESISQSIHSNSIWEEDKSCLKWLDDQPANSVIYVSFGSLVTVTKNVLTEFWHGLVNSGQRFLWVIRHDSITDNDKEAQIEEELKEGVIENGYIVSWAPQEEVLAHTAIGGFLTHSGWNSTLESIIEGVPMICWPQLADQQINSRYVEEVWKLGLDMKDTCDRVIIEKMVRDLMELRRSEFLQRANDMAKLARASVAEAGSSDSNLARLVQDIVSMQRKN